MHGIQCTWILETFIFCKLFLTKGSCNQQIVIIGITLLLLLGLF